ncbi:MAG: pyridoxamine 5'-phosphate oxidase family protein [Symploca sp. SIO1B1]|nr:pyridoxamine 5'-phosphate oxidase family protein [Symploca sp. SIO1B1]
MSHSEYEDSSEKLIPTQRSRIKRVPQRGQYERRAVDQILDEGLVCHVGFAIEQQPYVIPTAYGRVGDNLYIHGSPASRMLRSLQEGIEVCVTVTLLDGLVLARSAFHHSMNYRSVVVFGRATVVRDTQEKLEALQAFTEHVIPGRWDEVRPPSSQELQGTLVLFLPLAEASAKVRTGHPIDDETDYQLPIWAGVVPLHLAATEPVRDPRLPLEISVPAYALNYKRQMAEGRGQKAKPLPQAREEGRL